MDILFIKLRIQSFVETKRKNRYLFHDNYNGTLVGGMYVGKINEMCGDEQEEEVEEKQELRKSLLILMMMILPRIFSFPHLNT